MKTRNVFFLKMIVLIILLSFNVAQAQLISPKAKGTPSTGPTIDQAQKEDYMGPKARVAVTKFEDKSARGSEEIGNGMAEMLANALFATNRYIVLERQSLDDVIREQDLGASGRVKKETAAAIGEIEGADLLIEGTITEFAPDTSGAEGGLGGLLSRRSGVVGGILGGVKTSHLAMIIKVIDAKTGRRLASEQVEGKATDIAGLGSMSGSRLGGSLGGYSNTPMEKAIRIAIEEAVKLIVAKTPSEYYRASVPSQTKKAPTKQAVPSSETTLQPTVKTTDTEPRIVYVKWPTTSLREGPGTNFKALSEVKKGTALAILEEKGQWLRVSLEDGEEGWIGKATTSETP